MQSHLIETGDGRTQTRVFEVGQGTPLLYLHSAGGLYEGDSFLTAFGEHYHAYAPSLSGYLDSEGADNLRTMLDFTQCVPRSAAMPDAAAATRSSGAHVLCTHGRRSCIRHRCPAADPFDRADSRADENLR